MRRLLFSMLLLGGFFASAFPSAAPAAKAAAPTPDFPPGVFTDGSYHSLEDFKGKVVVLYFYEQDCPTCREHVPAINSVIQQFNGKPVVFLAVAAGDTLNDARRYLASTHLMMTTFADALSLMETRYGQKISLQNVRQIRILGPDGNIVGADSDVKAEPITAALASVHWKFRDQGYDPKLNPVIDLLEANRYGDALRALRPTMKAPKKEVSESAAKLHDAVLAEAQTWLTDADAAAETDPIKAYDLYRKVQALAGEDIAKSADAGLKKLAANKAVKAELDARGLYERLCVVASLATPNQKGQVMALAQMIATRDPGAPTAAKAAEVAKELSN